MADLHVFELVHPYTIPLGLLAPDFWLSCGSNFNDIDVLTSLVSECAHCLFLAGNATHCRDSIMSQSGCVGLGRYFVPIPNVSDNALS